MTQESTIVLSEAQTARKMSETLHICLLWPLAQPHQAPPVQVSAEEPGLLQDWLKTFMEKCTEMLQALTGAVIQPVGPAGAALADVVLIPMNIELAQMALRQQWELPFPNAKVVKVLTEAVPVLSQPESVQAAMEYPFFYIDKKLGIHTCTRPNSNREQEQMFYLYMAHLCYDILQALGREKAGLVTPAKKVFVSATGEDTLPERVQVVRELKMHGYAVQPTTGWPHSWQGLQLQIEEQLRGAQMVIFVLGHQYGALLGHEKISVEEAQFTYLEDHLKALYLTGVKKKGNKLRVLVWLRPDHKEPDGRQQLFISRLRQLSASDLYSLEIHAGSIEDFKTLMLQQESSDDPGAELNANARKKITHSDTSPSVYLISDPSDVTVARQVHGWLHDLGHQILWPGQQTEGATLRALHQEYLAKCDAVLIVYEQARPHWLEAKLQDLLKAPGMGRQHPLFLKAVFMPQKHEGLINNIMQKNPLHNDTQLIWQSSNFPPAGLHQFLKKLGQNIRDFYEI